MQWLTADLDWPRLVRWFPLLQAVDLPETRWQAVGRDGNLRLDGRLIFPQPLALTLEKWRVPVNAIHEPIASFTAVRGFASWLEKQNWAQPYEISPGPNQLFVWALTHTRSRHLPPRQFRMRKKALAQFEQKMSANTTGKVNS